MSSYQISRFLRLAPGSAVRPLNTFLERDNPDSSNTSENKKCQPPNSLGKVGDKELLVPTGQQGNTFAHVQDWVTARLKAKTSVKDVSTFVLVKGIKQWAVFEEKSGSRTIRTVFKIT